MKTVYVISSVSWEIECEFINQLIECSDVIVYIEMSNVYFTFSLSINLRMFECDMISDKSVQGFADSMSQFEEWIDVFINNAIYTHRYT